MTAASVSVASLVSSSANFIARVKPGMSDLIKATGAVVQTADTGQINWAATFTPATNTTGGYEIFRLDDTLQATVPVFIKVEYGWGASTSNPQVWVTVGSATDGAGTITGIKTTRISLFWTAADVWGSNTAHMCYATGAAADAALAWGGWWGSTAYSNTGGGLASGGGMFLVERSRDFDGTPNGDGVLLVAWTWGSSATTRYYSCPRFYVTGLPNIAAQTSGVPTISSGGALTGATGIVGSDTYVWPVFTGHYQFSIGGPSKYLVGYFSGDIPAGTQVPLTLYGASHTFLMGGVGMPGVGLRIS